MVALEGGMEVQRLLVEGGRESWFHSMIGVATGNPFWPTPTWGTNI
jgi:hypothetical protein